MASTATMRAARMVFLLAVIVAAAAAPGGAADRTLAIEGSIAITLGSGDQRTLSFALRIAAGERWDDARVHAALRPSVAEFCATYAIDDECALVADAAFDEASSLYARGLHEAANSAAAGAAAGTAGAAAGTVVVPDAGVDSSGHRRGSADERRAWDPDEDAQARTNRNPRPRLARGRALLTGEAIDVGASHRIVRARHGVMPVVVNLIDSAAEHLC